MGTRSLLAVETKKNVYHVQYMQFDGGVLVKGRDYYEAILATLCECHSYFINKHNNPNKKFAKRCVDFLNNYRYATAHSFKNTFKSSPDKFYKENYDQEWQYLFNLAGDFTILNVHGKDTFVIPWDITYKLALNSLAGRYEEDRFLTEFWQALNKNESAELKIEGGEAYAFLDQGKNGWRNYAILFVNGKRVVGSSFCEESYEHRNEYVLSTNVPLTEDIPDNLVVN